MELEKQLQSLREQVQSALAWRADQQATLEALHFDVKKAHEEKQQLQQQLSDIKQRMKEEEEKHQQHLLQLQTKVRRQATHDELGATRALHSFLSRFLVVPCSSLSCVFRIRSILL